MPGAQCSPSTSFIPESLTAPETKFLAKIEDDPRTTLDSKSLWSQCLLLPVTDDQCWWAASHFQQKEGGGRGELKVTEFAESFLISRTYSRKNFKLPDWHQKFGKIVGDLSRISHPLFGLEDQYMKSPFKYITDRFITLKAFCLFRESWNCIIYHFLHYKLSKCFF